MSDAQKCTTASGAGDRARSDAPAATAAEHARLPHLEGRSLDYILGVLDGITTAGEGLNATAVRALRDALDGAVVRDRRARP